MIEEGDLIKNLVEFSSEEAGGNIQVGEVLKVVRPPNQDDECAVYMHVLTGHLTDSIYTPPICYEVL